MLYQKRVLATEAGTPPSLSSARSSSLGMVRIRAAFSVCAGVSRAGIARSYSAVGPSVGAAVGLEVVGDTVGELVGDAEDGSADGARVGAADVGDEVVGASVGVAVVGAPVVGAEDVGAALGRAVVGGALPRHQFPSFPVPGKRRTAAGRKHQRVSDNV